VCNQMISVVIPFKEGQYLYNVIDTVLEQEQDVVFVLVSDAAPMPVVRSAKAQLKDHKYILCETGGFDSDLSVLAMNIGLYYSPTEEVLFLNDKSLISPFFLKQLDSFVGVDFIGWQLKYSTVEFDGEASTLRDGLVLSFEEDKLYRPVFMVNKTAAKDLGGFPYKPSTAQSVYAFQQQFLYHRDSRVVNLETTLLLDPKGPKAGKVSIPEGKQKAFNKDTVDMWGKTKWKNFLMERHV